MCEGPSGLVLLRGTNRISPCSCPPYSSELPRPCPWSCQSTTLHRASDAKSKGALASQARVLRDISWSRAAVRASEVCQGPNWTSLPTFWEERTAKISENHSFRSQLSKPFQTSISSCDINCKATVWTEGVCAPLVPCSCTSCCAACCVMPSPSSTLRRARRLELFLIDMKVVAEENPWSSFQPVLTKIH